MQFIGVGVTSGGVAREGAVEDVVEPVVNARVELAEIGDLLGHTRCAIARRSRP